MRVWNECTCNDSRLSGRGCPPTFRMPAIRRPKSSPELPLSALRLVSRVKTTGYLNRDMCASSTYTLHHPSILADCVEGFYYGDARGFRLRPREFQVRCVSFKNVADIEATKSEEAIWGNERRCIGGYENLVAAFSSQKGGPRIQTKGGI